MRNIKRTVLLALLGLSLAAAKDFKFELSDDARAGQAQLRRGKYFISLDGDKAVLKDKSGKTIDVKIRLEQMPGKVKLTTFSLSPDRQQLRSVTLGGTDTRIVFE